MPSISTSDDPLTFPGPPPGMDFVIEPYDSPTSGTQKLRIIYIRRPSSTDAQSPPPPPTPCPWLWRCHSCYTIYRLAVTRRCLDCDHTFCLGDATTTGSGSAAAPKGKKRKRGGPCKAEFDYNGWKTWGSWRRTRLLNHEDDITNQKSSWGDEYKAATEGTGHEETSFEEKREHLFLRKRHDCFLHCDFPSECHHALFRAQQEGRPILREALALDAAEGEEKKKGKRFNKRITVSEYKQRRATSGRFVEDLPRVDEADEEDNNVSPVSPVSPCSPTSPDPPGDLMREVSPIEREEGQGDDDNELPLSPRRRSLLVATDTPADFATTAAPFSFDDENTYSNDGDDEREDEEETRRARSRRKIAQLTGCEGLESFGPFGLDPSSPTSPSAAGGNRNLDLQAAYSEQAWFSSTPGSEQPLSPKSPERMGKRDRMLALLGRRGPPSPSSPTRSSSPGVFDMPARQNHHPQQEQQHADARAAAAGEGWEEPRFNQPSAASSASTTPTTTTSSSGPVMMHDDDTDTDADGDVPMRDVDKDVDEDIESPVTPPIGASGDEGEEDLRALLRLRNAFMRGDMI